MSAAAEMNRFLAEVEKRAFRMAQIAVKDADEALDIVQDTMFTLVRKYAGKPHGEWRPLFYRILQNRITDWHRHNTVKSRVFSFFTSRNEDGDVVDLVEQAPARSSSAPDIRAELDGATDELQAAVARLPKRQQQAFLLRTLEGMSVHDTARAMKCSDGSVKTHYSRAVHSLREVLKEHWS